MYHIPIYKRPTIVFLIKLPAKVRKNLQISKNCSIFAAWKDIFTYFFACSAFYLLFQHASNLICIPIDCNALCTSSSIERMNLLSVLRLRYLTIISTLYGIILSPIRVLSSMCIKIADWFIGPTHGSVRRIAPCSIPMTNGSMFNGIMHRVSVIEPK